MREEKDLLQLEKCARGGVKRQSPNLREMHATPASSTPLLSHIINRSKEKKNAGAVLVHRL